jgi:SAM-dependent methyltransferase
VIDDLQFLCRNIISRIGEKTMSGGRVYFDGVLTESSPQLYDAFAVDNVYETFSANLDYNGYKSVVEVWRSLHSTLTSDTNHSVFDAGCGTGLVGAELIKHYPQLKIYGGDYSPGMIEQSKLKNAYCDLQVVDLKQPLPYEKESFDSIISSGVFLQGHCGPESIPNIMHVLKKNCHLVTTIRQKYYDEVRVEWDRVVKDCGGEQLSATEMPYNAEAIGLVLVIHKK